MNFVEELSWRGMIHDIIPGTEEILNSGPQTGYIGFDPTAPSLTIGNLVTIMMLVHFQRAGHKPIALVGGATGMIGDPSGKSEERKLLSIDELVHNEGCIKDQLSSFLDFGSNSNQAEIVNNYDWFKDFNVIDFFRDVGKHLTVNYMVAKDSVKRRLETGMSFTEFSYQLIQGYDFYWLYANKNCILQMGGSDQWGNITAGTELVRRKTGGEAFAITCPLITKADGTKFGKSEGGENIWLDPVLTSPYKFYQFWLNCSDVDAGKFIRIFTLKTKEDIEALEQEHAKAPHERILQKELGKEVTTTVHSEEEYNAAVEASEILFGKGTVEMLKSISEKNLLSAFEGVPQKEISRSTLENGGIEIVDFLVDKTGILPSRGEARRMLDNNAIRVNKEQVNIDAKVTSDLLLNNKYMIVQRGKKNYFLVKVI